MRKFSISAAAAAMAAVLGASSAWSETLTDALIAAYQNSNLLEQNRALLRAADEDAAQALSAMRPIVQFTADAQYSFARQRVSSGLLPTLGPKTNIENLQSSIGLTTSVTLLDFGRNRLAHEAAKETVLATREALLQVEQQVLLSAVTAYVNVRLAQDIVDLRQNNVRLISEELDASQDRFDVGEVTRTDVALAESALATARSGLTQAQGDLTVAREAYLAATGNQPGALSTPPTPPATARTLDEAKSIALRTHPNIRQAQRLVTVAELNVERAKADTRPTVSASAGLGYDDGGNENASVGLSLNHTLYSGGRLSSVYRQSLADRDAQRSSLQQTGVTVGQEVGIAWSAVDVARASISAAGETISAARIAFEGIREEAALGARTTLDVLDAEQDLLDAQFTRVEAEAQRYLGVYQVLSSMGLLTVEHLGLGIPTYDAAAYYNSVKNAPSTSTQGRKLDRVMQAIGRNN
ncbi:TolC family outer membrane protein [Cereibacter sp. SYSU M97828]|nr:TolC family outer membrane protein [Cereibacter flavus]